jgi:hypothetical protein
VLVADDLDAELGAPTALQAQRQPHPAVTRLGHGGLHRALGKAQPLVGDHALGHLNEPVAHLAVARPRPESTQEPAPGAAHVEPQRCERELDAQRAELEQRSTDLEHACTLPRRRSRRAGVHSSITPSFRALHRNEGFAGESAGVR